MTERSDDLLEPDDRPDPDEDASETGEDEDDPGLSAEESLGLLPPD
jgi:hypothetical protein